ncbi:MAG: nickel insertion protein, partial [Spirochaetota bacterium]
PEGINALRIIDFVLIQEIKKTKTHKICPEHETSDEAPPDTVVVTEVTIDDSTPEEISVLQEELFSSGALDVFFTPVFMKKNRPAFNITVICAPGEFERCAQTIFLKSSSLGLRYQYFYRKCLARESIPVSTEYGDIPVKIGCYQGKIVQISPEFEHCKKIAEQENLSLREVYNRVILAYKNSRNNSTQG